MAKSGSKAKDTSPKTPLPPSATPSDIKPAAPSPQDRIIGVAGNRGLSKPFIDELGNTGLLQTGGFLYEEFLPQLRGIWGAKKYQEMADNDPILSAIVFALTMLVRQVEWHFEPADDSDDAAKCADFAEGLLFEDMSEPWTDVISEIMTMVVHGYSIFEIVWKVRAGRTGEPYTDSAYNDHLIGIARLAPRSQLTVWRWIFNYSGYVAGVQQVLYNTGAYPESMPSTLQSKGMVTIPAEKMLMFRIGAVRGNPESKSLLRSCYIPYLRKQTIEDAEGRLAKRSAGIVVMTIPQEYMDAGADEQTQIAYRNYQNIATMIAQDRNASIILPSDCWESGQSQGGKPKFDIRYVSVDGPKSQDSGAIIERLDKRMAMSVLADFIMIGHSAKSGGGSYALSSNKTDTFMTALSALVNSIADVINRDLLPKVWRYNGMDDDLMPKMIPDAIESPNLAEVGQFLTGLAQAGAELFPDMTLENALRHMAGLPEKEDDSITAQIDDAHGRASLASAEMAADNPVAPGMLAAGAAPPGGGPPKPGQPPAAGKPAAGKPAPGSKPAPKPKAGSPAAGKAAIKKLMLAAWNKSRGN